MGVHSMGYRSDRSAYSVLVIILVNALLFIAGLARGDLIFVLGLRPTEWLSSPWAMITSLFVHAGIGHIAANMIGLYFFGTFLTALVGEARFLIVYFLGGIAGSLVFVLLAPVNSIAVGASGAIFAVGGTLATIRPKLRVYVFPIPAPIPIWAALLGGLIILSFVPGVAWQAHLGGLVLGVIAGYFVRRRQRTIIL